MTCICDNQTVYSHVRFLHNGSRTCRVGESHVQSMLTLTRCLPLIFLGSSFSPWENICEVTTFIEKTQIMVITITSKIHLDISVVTVVPLKVIIEVVKRNICFQLFIKLGFLLILASLIHSGLRLSPCVS